MPLPRFDRDLPRHGVRGRVAAVFRTAALVALEEPGGLLTLVLGSRPLLPWSVCVPDLAPVGTEIRLEERRLFVGDRFHDLQGEGVDLRVPRLEGLPAPRGGGGNRALLRAQRDAMVIPPRSREVLETHADRIRAFLEREDPRVLSGLGEGSTPTGDDVLTGMAAVRSRLVEPGLPVLRLPTSTTPAARAMLFHAARGHFPEPLSAWAAALGDPRADFPFRVAALLAVGARSGADMLAGGVAWLDRWLCASSLAS